MSRMFCPECASDKIVKYKSRSVEDLWTCVMCGWIDDASAFDVDQEDILPEYEGRDLYGEEDIDYGLGAMYGSDG